MKKRGQCPICGYVRRTHFETYKTKKDYPIVRCQNCRFIYSLNIPDDVVHVNREAFSMGNIKGRLEDKIRVFDGKTTIYKQILNAIKRHGGRGQMLDVGTSLGYFLDHAKHQGFNTAGIDLSKDVIDFLNIKGHSAYCGTLVELSLPANSFDVVTYLEVLEHVENPVSELLEARRVLRSGGILCIELPNALFHYLKGKIEQTNFYKTIVKQGVYGLMPDIHVNHFTIGTCNKMLNNLGFDVCELMIREPLTEIPRYSKIMVAVLNVWIRVCQLVYHITNINIAPAFIVIAKYSSNSGLSENPFERA